MRKGRVYYMMITRERMLGPSIWLLIVGAVDFIYNGQPTVPFIFIGLGVVGILAAWFSPVGHIGKKRKFMASALWLLLLGYFVWYTVTHGGVF